MEGEFGSGSMACGIGTGSMTGDLSTGSMAYGIITGSMTGDVGTGRTAGSDRVRREFRPAPEA